MNRIFLMFMMTAVSASVLMFQGCVKNPALSGPPVHSVPDSAISLDASNFDSLVMKSGTVAIVEFYSPNCSVCAEMMWIIDSLAKTIGDSALVGTVNTSFDDSLWRKFSVNAVPTYLFFKNGSLVAQGSFSSPDPTVYDTLLALLRKLIAGTYVIDTADTNRHPDTIPEGIVMLDSANFSTMTTVPGRVAMIDFFSPTCMACQMMDSVVAALAGRYAGAALIGKVNVLEDRTVQYTFNIQWWPTFVFLVGGSEVRRVVGITPEDSLAAILDSLFVTNPHP
jgi:thioredoxin 1